MTFVHFARKQITKSEVSFMLRDITEDIKTDEDHDLHDDDGP